MLEGVALEAADGAGVVAVVIALGWLVVTGRLVPRRTYEDKVAEAKEWRAESQVKDQQLAEKDVQLRHLTEVGITVDKVMTELQAQGRRRDP